MGIEINNVNSGRPDNLKRQSASKTSADTSDSKVKTSGDSPASASVSLSSDAKNLAQIESDLKSLPEIDKSKVEEIKARIASGEYHIDFEKVAQKMLDIES